MKPALRSPATSIAAGAWLLALACAACSPATSPAPAAPAFQFGDGHVDLGGDPDPGAVEDVADPSDDDIAAEDESSLADTVLDAVPDAIPDAAPDAVPDTVSDTPPDAVADAAEDTVPDSVSDTAPDAVPDTAPDAVADAAPDTAPDAEPDAAPDAEPDVEPDAPPACVAAPESCNGKDDDCDGKTDEAGTACPGPGEACVLGACTAACYLPVANPCAAGTTCNVGDDAFGKCLPAGAPCLVSHAWVACGAAKCGPGTLCHPQQQACVPDLPCSSVACVDGWCHGEWCSCQRPAAPCQPAGLDAMNDQKFAWGLVDLDVDLQCGAWAVTIVGGTDYLRRLGPDGALTIVPGVSNLDMGEVAVLQGYDKQFGGKTIEVALTYICYYGCWSATPQGVAWYDQKAGTLPMVLPTNVALKGNGPFGNMYLDVGPAGLTWGLGSQVYIGNLAVDGDLQTVDLASGKQTAVTQLPARVYAAAPFDGTRLLVALASNQIVLVHEADGATTPFAATPAAVTGVARDPYSGRVMVALAGGEVRTYASDGTDLGPFAQAPASGRISIGPDGGLYLLQPAPDGVAKVVRWALPAAL